MYYGQRWAFHKTPSLSKGGSLYTYMPTKTYNEYIKVKARRIRNLIRTRYGLPLNTSFTTHIESDGFDLSLTATTRDKCLPFPASTRHSMLNQIQAQITTDEPTKTLLIDNNMEVPCSKASMVVEE
ncbi:hypothetical protein ADUPG1_013741 [Aduncisulcus paluster]|uniref:Uncharacterized protein n=1 Tax=Aduncisulcus paluster TaxID=2918883 RepID=A0ABQ5K407_9EUKA|nr:hypothetical protein ADUPG1_013741 [Aduncisulcus paluster]